MGGWNTTHVVYSPTDLQGTHGRKAGSPAVAVCPGSGRLAVAFITDDTFDGTPPSNYVLASQVKALVSHQSLREAGQNLTFPTRPTVTLGTVVPSLWPQMMPVGGSGQSGADILTAFQSSVPSGGAASIDVIGSVCG